MSPFRNSIYRMLMSSRVVLAALFANHMVHDGGLVVAAVTAAVLLHHFRAFDTNYETRTGGEKAFYILAGIVCIGTLLVCAGQPWLLVALRVALAVIFAFLIPGLLSYAILPPYEEKPIRFRVDSARRLG